MAATFNPPDVTGPGATPVTLTVTTTATAAGNYKVDIGGNLAAAPAGCSLELTVTIRPGFSLVINGIEVTQGVQTTTLPPRGADGTTPYRGVLLASAGITVVRVYANARYGPADGIPGIEASLTGFKSGSTDPLPGSPIKPEWGARALKLGASTVSGAERSDPNGSYDFTLPPSWTTGTIDLQAQIGGAASGAFGGADECSSDACKALKAFRLNGISFTPTQDVYLFPVALVTKTSRPIEPSYTCYTVLSHEGGYEHLGGGYSCPTLGVFSGATNIVPLGDGNLVVPGYRTAIDISDIAAMTFDPSVKNASTIKGQATYNRLWSVADNNPDGFFDGDSFDPTQQHLIMGVFPSSAGIRSYTSEGKCRSDSGWFECDEWRVASVQDSGRPLTAVSHEMFHLFGFEHASNCVLSGGSKDVGKFDPWPPDGQGYIQGVGLDRRAGSSTAGPHAVLVPTAAAPIYDLMGYCTSGDGNAWISTRNWNGTLSEFATGEPRTPSMPSALVPTETRLDAAVEEPTLVASALVDAIAGAFFLTVDPMRTPRTGAPGTSAYHLVARDSSGARLADATMVSDASHSDEAAGGTVLRGQVPAANVVSLEIVRDGMVVARRTRATRAPSVLITAPVAGSETGRTRTTEVRWTSTTGKVSELHSLGQLATASAIVEYSRDDGRTWRVIYSGPDNGRAALPSQFFAASDRARVRVTINDGFRIAAATSGTFSAIGAPPQVAILSPIDGARFARGASVYLSGQAFDDRGRQISGDSLAWYANDRRVAAGQRAAAATLPAGSTVIKLVAHDTRGRAGGAQLCVHVVPGRAVTTTSLADCERPALTDPATRLVIPYVAPAASVMSWWWIALLAAAIAAVIVIALVLRTRSNRRSRSAT